MEPFRELLASCQALDLESDYYIDSQARGSQKIVKDRLIKALTAAGDAYHKAKSNASSVPDVEGMGAREQWVRLPNEQTWYWHWNGEDLAVPHIYSVMTSHSGRPDRYFVAYPDSRWCDELGGWWLKIDRPNIPSREYQAARSLRGAGGERETDATTIAKAIAYWRDRALASESREQEQAELIVGMKSQKVEELEKERKSNG